MDKKFDRAVWDSWRRSQFEDAYGDPSGWIRASKNLIEAASLLSRNDSAGMAISLRNVNNGGSTTDEPATAEEERIVSSGIRTHTVKLMLFGFAAESLLKAVYVKRGGVLQKDGRYRSPKRLNKTHNLLEIAEALDCAAMFSSKQLDLLDLLSATNEMGRYPAHSRYDDYGLQPPRPDGTARFYGIWSPSTDSVTLYEVLDILFRSLDEVIPPAADALVEESRVISGVTPERESK